MLDLSRVTLLFVETRAHKITQRVVDDCLRRCTFGDVLIFTDKPQAFNIPGARYISVPDFPNKKLAGEFYYGHAMAHVNTEFALLLEWDGGIFDETRWLPQFFDYDYVGAPWNVRPGDPYDVGNGGFTLMSTRLGHYICANLSRYPVTTDWDVCRVQRIHYEQAGFRWPDRVLAGKFSWELTDRDPEHFGYHGAFTWPWTLSREEMLIRARLMLEAPYLMTKMTDLIKKDPTIWQELGPTAEARWRTGHHLIQAPQRQIGQIELAQQRLALRQRRQAIFQNLNGKA